MYTDRPFRDNLDAAQTGAMAKHLNFELDYLTIRMKTYSPSMLFTYGSKWKFITIQIGSEFFKFAFYKNNPFHIWLKFI